MIRNRTVVALMVGLLTVGLLGSVSAKSLYVVASLSSSTPLKAYNINPTTGLITLQTTYSVSGYSGGAVDITIDSDSGILFVVYEFSNVINIVDGKTMKSVGTTTMPVSSARSAGIVYDHVRKRLYVAYRSKGTIYSYSWNAGTKKLTYIGNFSLSGVSSTYGIDLDEGKGLLYVGSKNNTVRYFDVTKNFAAMGSITVNPPSGSHIAVGVAVDATRQYLYTGAGSEGSGDSYLCQHNLTTKAVVKCVSGKVVRGLTVDSDTGYVYATTYTSKNVMVYDSKLNQKQSTGSIGTPTGLVVPGKDISYNPLNLTKSDGLNDAKDCINIGSNITYTISYQNKNSYKVTNAVITDTPPTEVSPVSANKGGAYLGGTVTWKLGTINPGATGSVQLVVKIKATTPQGSTIKNSATIKSDQTPPTSQSDITKVCKIFCGDGKVNGSEICDTGIPPGKPGACPVHCNDNNPCTKDVMSGSKCMAKCSNTVIPPNPTTKDGCCPKGHTSKTDADCLPPCGPDRTKNCVKTCQNVKCPAGQHCENGKCVPDAVKDAGPPKADKGNVQPPKKTEAGVVIPAADTGTSSGGDAGDPLEGGEDFTAGTGCACQTGPVGSLPLLMLVGLLLVLARRRRTS